MDNNVIYNSKSFRFGFDFYPDDHEVDSLKLPSTKASICVLVHADKLQKENKVFIEKVLSSIRIDSEKDYMIVVAQDAPHWQEIKENFPELQLFIAFGYRPSDLRLQTQNLQNRWIYIEDIQLIFTKSIEKLEPDPDLKIQFWDQLKKYSNR